MKRVLLCFVGLSLLQFTALADTKGDPHYTEAGFFDIHVCNWPDRPPFIMALFSTLRFEEVSQVSIYKPTGRKLGNLNLEKFRAFKNKEGKPKRAFITNFDLPEQNTDGWYRAVITMKDGGRYEARDFVVHTLMPHPTGMQPPANSTDIPAPSELRWDRVPGASHYQIFIYDRLVDELIFTSPVMTSTALKLPDGLLKAGGIYGWKVNARDTNEHVLLGDFNHGTTGREAVFTVKQP